MTDKSITVELELNYHCIETAARKRIKSLMGQIVENGNVMAGEPVIEAYEMLKRFVDVSDFHQIRNKRPELDGRGRVKVCITEMANDKLFTIRVIE